MEAAPLLPRMMARPAADDTGPGRLLIHLPHQGNQFPDVGDLIEERMEQDLFDGRLPNPSLDFDLLPLVFGRQITEEGLCFLRHFSIVPLHVLEGLEGGRIDVLPGFPRDVVVKVRILHFEEVDEDVVHGAVRGLPILVDLLPTQVPELSEEATAEGGDVGEELFEVSEVHRSGASVSFDLTSALTTRRAGPYVPKLGASP